VRSTRFPGAPLEPACVRRVRFTDHPGAVGHVTGFQSEPGGADLNITAGDAVVRLTVVAGGILRIRLAPQGKFSDPTDGEIVELPDLPVQGTFSQDATHFEFAAGGMLVKGSISPLLLSLWRSDGTQVWQELEPMAWNETSTWQTLSSAATEKVYGCGMQNGYFDHTGRDVSISEGGGWDVGGRANPVPFFMSSTGYGMLRNTFSPGRYMFQQQRMLIHDDHGLDAFYFVAPDMKEVLGLYTSITGGPVLPPIWGLWLGDSDCYNNQRHNFSTSYALEIARNYSVHDMPRGWMLVNDGYGCGYTSREELQHTEDGMAANGLRMGLWTSTGLANASWEIGSAGSRAIKTDVAWVGSGYRFGLQAVKLAANLMQNNSNSRPYTWTVCGWAGTHKYAVVWTGDNTGGWEFIRMQIPTVIGSGLSALAHASGDVDGIFGGSPETYVRDLQWKTFLTASMTMSGWAPRDKQPWTFGEPYTRYNRQALRLKARLTPYLYTLSYEAHVTGVPPVRAMPLEFPNEPWVGVNTSFSFMYQFMSGPFFLVAPVFRNESTRSGIALPAGEWIDYSSGERFEGPKVVDDYPAPLDVLPVFVKAGAIVPMWPLMDFVGQRPVDELTLDIFPTSAAGGSQFTLHEDDGLTRNYVSGQVATQTFTVIVSLAGSVSVEIGKSLGAYEGKPSRRSYILQVHAASPLPRCSCEALEATAFAQGWATGCGAPGGHGSLVYIKTGHISSDSSASVDLQLEVGGLPSHEFESSLPTDDDARSFASLVV